MNIPTWLRMARCIRTATGMSRHDHHHHEHAVGGDLDYGTGPAAPTCPA